MSWQDDIENVIFTIITGDNKEWFPKWRNAVKDIDYNTSIFEFVNVEGSLVLRQKQKGRRFELEFYFDGEEAVQNGNSFEFSARDNRLWTVKHPFFGEFKCHPLSLKQDNSFYNVSKFNVPVVETITEAYPESSQVFQDQIEYQVEITNEAQAQSLEDSGELDKVELVQNVTFLDNVFSKIIKTGESLKEFKELVSDAVIEITDITSTGLSIIRTMQSLINYPATISQTLESRFNTFVEALDGLIDSFDGNKHQFESIGGNLIAAMSLSSINNDYEIRKSVLAQQDLLLTEYNKYLVFLDSLQTDRADSDDSYIPDFDSLNELNSLIGLTVSSLYNIAFLAKQEREYILDKDSNIILLTHKFYGLDKEDINISKFMNTNDIGLNEMINIRKGRKIVYYV